MPTDARDDSLEPLRKRLRFRAHHMGMHENDVLFGSFADAWLHRFDHEKLEQFERLLAENDNDLYDWVTGRRPWPQRHDNDVARLLMAHQPSPTKP